MSGTTNTLKNLPHYFLLCLLFLGSLVMSSCNQQAQGFALPKGDIERGAMIYRSFSCNSCHSISNVEWQGGADDLNIPLGGAVSTQKTYGELVTSVINPSHKIAPSYQQTTTDAGLSKMENYNEVMTVQELIDLIAYLQSEYDIVPPTTEYYPYY